MKPVDISIHAKVRGGQYGLNANDIQYLWDHAEQTHLPINRLFYKIKKYKDDPDSAYVEYWWSKGFLITYNSWTNCIITITRKPRNRVMMERSKKEYKNKLRRLKRKQWK